MLKEKIVTFILCAMFLKGKADKKEQITDIKHKIKQKVLCVSFQISL